MVIANSNPIDPPSTDPAAIAARAIKKTKGKPEEVNAQVDGFLFPVHQRRPRHPR